jgi:hypothetical protein
VEISVSLIQAGLQYVSWIVGGVMLVVALMFVWRSFYAMRIPKDEASQSKPEPSASTAGAHH